MPLRSIAARISFGAFVAALVIALTASIGTRLGLWLYTTGFEVLLPAVVIGGVAVLAGAWWLASALRNNNSEGWRWGFPGLAGALVLVWIPLSAAYRAYEAPPIHDISTDIEYAPPFEALLPLRKGSPNGPEYDGPKKVVLRGKITTVAELQKKAYPDIKPHAALVDPHYLPADATPQSYWFWRALRARQAHGLERRRLRRQARPHRGDRHDLVVRLHRRHRRARRDRGARSAPRSMSAPRAASASWITAATRSAYRRI